MLKILTIVYMLRIYMFRVQSIKPTHAFHLGLFITDFLFTESLEARIAHYVQKKKIEICSENAI